MERVALSSSFGRKQAMNRICIVSSSSTELLEMHSEDPSLHILFIPGNPGIASYYKDFAEALYELLEGHASITAIGHISHSRKDWEHGRMFSLQEQINHKVDFIKQEHQNSELPIILVGHSIGSYISLEIFKRLPQQGFLGSFPTRVTSAIVRRSLGRSWSATAVDVTCSHLVQYHTMRNVLFMAMTEFKKLAEEPDWEFMKRKQNQITLLFGIDDHWGPLSLFEEVSRQAPGIALSIEREGHTHAYCCSEAGSAWVARYVADLVKNQISN